MHPSFGEDVAPMILDPRTVRRRPSTPYARQGDPGTKIYPTQIRRPASLSPIDAGVALDGTRPTPISRKIASERSSGLASCSHSTRIVKTAHPARKAPLLHFPFRRLAICLDCDA